MECNMDNIEKVIRLAKAFDAWRVFPRIFISVYITLLYKSVVWFMSLPAPSVEQAGLISVITGIGAAWFTAYVNSSKRFDHTAKDDPK